MYKSEGDYILYLEEYILIMWRNLKFGGSCRNLNMWIMGKEGGPFFLYGNLYHGITGNIVRVPSIKKKTL